jgi:serine/threonine protein kinase
MLTGIDLAMETIGSYRILSQLGAGGMGTVYLAEHRFLKRRSAIKVLLADLASRPDLLERFFAEARATSQIEHPGIVRIFDCELDSAGQPYFVMELLEGETLAAHLRQRGRLAPAEAAGYALAMAEAMAAAHGRGIIHRDIKPDNVFVRPGPPLGIKLVDFGIAKLAGEFRAGSRARTQTGTILGTPPYMSPEQCRGAGTIDHRTDVYSLGCVLFEMLCGAPPFVRDNTGGYLVAHMTQAPPAAHDINPEVPRALSDIVAALLRKPPEDRPRTMLDVAELLAPFAPPAPATGTSSSGARGVPSGPGAVGVAAAEIDATVPQTPWRPLQTTLRSTAGEMRSPDEGESDAEGRPPRRRGIVWGAAILSLLGAAGVLVWRSGALPSAGRRLSPAAAVSAPGGHTEVPAPGPAATPPAAPSPSPATMGAPAPAVVPNRRAAAPVTAAVAPPRAIRPPARNPGAAAVAATAPAGAAGLPPPPPPDSPAARGFVVVDLDSKPTGASICFEGDRRFITVTHGAVQLPYDPRPVTFLIDLPGHLPARLTIKSDHDSRRVVQLQPLPAGQAGQPACVY